MKVVHVQASMGYSGNAAYRLSSAMRKNGIDSWVLNLAPSAEKDYSYIVPQKEKSVISRGIDFIVKYFRKKGHKAECYFYTPLPYIGYNIVQHPLVRDADAIYIHWVSGLLTINNIEDVAQTGKPVIIFMHDTWFFTGGCHHTMGCDRYEYDCKNCPMFEKSKTSVGKQLKSKESLFSKYKNIHFVSPSKWMADLARKSKAIDGSRVFHIPNVVDEACFKPLEKRVARYILNLPDDKKVITFGCIAGQGNPFKGWQYLEEAINKLDLDNVEILIYGSGYNQETVDKVKYPIHFLGRINDDIMLSLICNATDVFVTPSLCESFSLVILENLRCGTPCVGFNTTAIPELLQTGKTGYLARFKDSNDLANGIIQMIEHPIKVCVSKELDADCIVNRHIELIKRICNG